MPTTLSPAAHHAAGLSVGHTFAAHVRAAALDDLTTRASLPIAA
jgi:hypothetical protein